MDGLILLVVLLPIAFLILLIVIVYKTSSNQQTLDFISHKIEQLNKQLQNLDKQLKELKKHEVPPEAEPEIKQERITPIPRASAPVQPPVIHKEQIPGPLVEKQKSSLEETPVPATEKKETIPIHEPPVTVTTETKAPPVFTTEPPEKKKTDWEKFIGENLANKIGIAILVLGISFFVKFAIDKDWINETGRVIIGLLSGGILIGLAHYIRNNYRSFSSVLVGGGLAVFYFTIAFAFHQYHLMSQQAAFIIMVVITAFAVILSVFYNRMELAILAAVGGFITPFLVSTGQNNYVALFTHLCILNTGLLVLSWFKQWKAINIIALFFTVIIYGSWLTRQIFNDNEPFPYSGALFFATLFYALSLTTHIINNLKLKIKFGAFDFTFLLALNFLFYSAGIIILEYWSNGEYDGLFTASLGMINLALAWIFFKKKNIDQNFIYLLIGLTLTFISLTGPVQLKGNHISLFWAAEIVLLFWLYQRSGIKLLKIVSLLILPLLLISLFMDWQAIYIYNYSLIPVITNKGFITTLVTAIALLIYYKLMRKEADTFYFSTTVTNKSIRNILLITGALLTYAAGAWEIYYQFTTRLPETDIYAVYLQLYSFAFIILTILPFKKSPSFIFTKLLLTIAGFVLYVFHLDINYSISLAMLTTGNNRIHFVTHWISVVLLIWLLYNLIKYYRKQQILKEYEIPFTWITTSCLIFILSVEMFYVIMWANYQNEKSRVYWENLYYKAGLSIIWGLCSFTMMWLGMKHRFKILRIISLTLFTVTLVKLFIYDIRNIPPGGKIAAFILLGVLLLIVSFMYQRLKKIIMDDEQKA
jgi:uncharacterized membrane protein